MNRIQSKFAQLKEQGKKALIPYITAGDPKPTITVPLMHALVAGGADVVELGVAFSDPMAEGPVIEAAHHRALLHHVSLKNVLEMVREFRQQDKNTPVVLMGYLNTFERMGYAQFATLAHEVGVDGVIIVDLPPEEASEWLTELARYDIYPVFLVAPTTTDERIKMISEHTKGYLYCVALKGITGSQHLHIGQVTEQLAKIRHFTSLPLAVGFGIRDAASAANVAKIADAAIIGSALISHLAALPHEQDLICQEAVEMLKEIRTAIDKTS